MEDEGPFSVTGIREQVMRQVSLRECVTHIFFFKKLIPEKKSSF